MKLSIEHVDKKPFRKSNLPIEADIRVVCLEEENCCYLKIFPPLGMEFLDLEFGSNFHEAWRNWNWSLPSEERKRINKIAKSIGTTGVIATSTFQALQVVIPANKLNVLIAYLNGLVEQLGDSVCVPIPCWHYLLPEQDQIEACEIWNWYQLYTPHGSLLPYEEKLKIAERLLEAVRDRQPDELVPKNYRYHLTHFGRFRGDDYWRVTRLDIYRLYLARKLGFSSFKMEVLHETKRVPCPGPNGEVFEYDLTIEVPGIGEISFARELEEFLAFLTKKYPILFTVPDFSS